MTANEGGEATIDGIWYRNFLDMQSKVILRPCVAGSGGIVSRYLAFHSRCHANMIAGESFAPDISCDAGIRTIDVDGFTRVRCGVICRGLGSDRSVDADVITGAGSRHTKPAIQV